MADLRRLMLASGLMAGAVGLPVAMASDDRAVTKPGAASLSRLRFPEGSRHALLADRMWLYGQPAKVLVFDVPMKSSDLIRHLSAQQSGLADLNVLPGQLILSGRIGDEQWVAQMEAAGSGRTVGSISSLRLPALPQVSSQTSAQTLPQAVFSPPTPAWLPEGSRLRLDFVVTDEGVRVSERIWQHAFAPVRMMSVLEARLLMDGWRRPADDGKTQSWERGRQRLRISVVPLGTGSGLRVTGWTS
ncbi:hypothetical protein [Achromobacter sp. UMC46]|uniref:hypothetical protein n=1 Tax=Achromobacter sp. UMC46 TaxID=1862319 RepID=UPI002102F2D6|nr:hypothetical protein [Achromobacter sp. UMC46]